MNYKKLIGIVAAGIISTSVAADQTGPYVSASIGLNTLGDDTLNINFEDNNVSSEAEFDAGFGSGGAVGYRFSNNFSIEGEFMYRTVDLDTVDTTLFGTVSEGNFANTQLNVNAYYHFNLFGNSNYETYLGGGLAYVNEVDIDFENDAGETSFETDEFGVELMAGARYHFNDQWFVDVGFRYLLIGDVEMEQPNNSSNTVEAEYNPFMASVKLGWRF